MLHGPSFRRPAPLPLPMALAVVEIDIDPPPPYSQASDYGARFLPRTASKPLSSHPTSSAAQRATPAASKGQRRPHVDQSPSPSQPGSVSVPLFDTTRDPSPSNDHPVTNVAITSERSIEEQRGRTSFLDVSSDVFIPGRTSILTSSAWGFPWLRRLLRRLPRLPQRGTAPHRVVSFVIRLIISSIPLMAAGLVYALIDLSLPVAIVTLSVASAITMAGISYSLYGLRNGMLLGVRKEGSRTAPTVQGQQCPVPNTVTATSLAALASASNPGNASDAAHNNSVSADSRVLPPSLWQSNDTLLPIVPTPKIPLPPPCGARSSLCSSSTLHSPSLDLWLSKPASCGCIQLSSLDPARISLSEVAFSPYCRHHAASITSGPRELPSSSRQTPAHHSHIPVREERTISIGSHHPATAYRLAVPDRLPLRSIGSYTFLDSANNSYYHSALSSRCTMVLDKPASSPRPFQNTTSVSRLHNGGNSYSQPHLLASPPLSATGSVTEGPHDYRQGWSLAAGTTPSISHIAGPLLPAQRPTQRSGGPGCPGVINGSSEMMLGRPYSHEQGQQRRQRHFSIKAVSQTSSLNSLTLTSSCDHLSRGQQAQRSPPQTPLSPIPVSFARLHKGSSGKKAHVRATLSRQSTDTLGSIIRAYSNRSNMASPRELSPKTSSMSGLNITSNATSRKQMHRKSTPVADEPINESKWVSLLWPPVPSALEAGSASVVSLESGPVTTTHTSSDSLPSLLPDKSPTKAVPSSIHRKSCQFDGRVVNKSAADDGLITSGCNSHNGIVNEPSMRDIQNDSFYSILTTTTAMSSGCRTANMMPSIEGLKRARSFESEPEYDEDGHRLKRSSFLLSGVLFNTVLNAAAQQGKAASMPNVMVDVHPQSQESSEDDDSSDGHGSNNSSNNNNDNIKGPPEGRNASLSITATLSPPSPPSSLPSISSWLDKQSDSDSPDSNNCLTAPHPRQDLTTKADHILAKSFEPLLMYSQSSLVSPSRPLTLASSAANEPDDSMATLSVHTST